jgi:ribosomal protein S27E
MNAILLAKCPQCGSSQIMPVSQAPDTPMKCDSCGAQLGTVGEATRALEKAKQSINEHLGEALADDSDLKME